MIHDAFICYTSVDKPLAGLTRDNLESSGIRCYDPFRDTTIGGDTMKESLAAISSSRVLVYIYTDDANLDSHLIKLLDAAKRLGTEIVTLRMSASMPLGRIGYYMTIPFTVDARNEELQKSIDLLSIMVKQTLELVDENRARTPERWTESRGKNKFKLPGFDSGKWYLSLIMMMIYVLSAVIILMSVLTLRTSNNIIEDVITTVGFIMLFVVPILLLGNFLGIRDKFPIVRKRKPFLTIAVIVLLDGLIFFVFDIILLIVEKMR